MYNQNYTYDQNYVCRDYDYENQTKEDTVKDMNSIESKIDEVQQKINLLEQENNEIDYKNIDEIKI